MCIIIIIIIIMFTVTIVMCIIIIIIIIITTTTTTTTTTTSNNTIMAISIVLNRMSIVRFISRGGAPRAAAADRGSAAAAPGCGASRTLWRLRAPILQYDY